MILCKRMSKKNYIYNKKKKKNKNNRNSSNIKIVAALITIIFLLCVGGALWFYAAYKVAYMQIYDIEIKTSESNHIGFNADPTLHFGKIPSTGGVSTKEIYVYNDWIIYYNNNIGK